MSAVSLTQLCYEHLTTRTLPEQPPEELLQAMREWRIRTESTGKPGTDDMIRRIYTSLRQHLVNTEPSS